MTEKKTTTLVFRGELYEGKDCLIVKNGKQLRIVGESVENFISEFTDKNVELIIDIVIRQQS